MNDKSYKRTVERIQRIFFKITSALNLSQVEWELVFIRERSECHEDGGTTVAEIFPNWQYGAATVKFYIWMFEDRDDDEAADVIIHELVHYWLNPISRYGSSKEYDILEEKVCTDVARAIRTAISSAGKEVGDHWKLETKRLQREIKKLQAEAKGAA